MKEGILRGIRVLDLTRVLAGPYATRTLGDFGAEIIKVQTKKTARGAEANISGYFKAWNRNKKSITLDLSYPEARQLLLRLVAMSDALVENFSPRVMKNWDLGYENLRRTKPDIIMLSMSGMGQTGPWKDHIAFGPTIQSLAGLTYLTSYDKNLPVGPGYAHADILSGLFGALSVLIALDNRDRTGKGLYIDLSEYEAVCALLGPSLMKTFLDTEEILPEANRSSHPNAAPYGCYRCQGVDKWCVVAVYSDMEWQKLCDIIGNPTWCKENRFSTQYKRMEHKEELDTLIGEWTSNYPADELVAYFQEIGVAAGVVQNAEDLAHDSHLLSRNFFVSLNHPLLGKTTSDGTPINFAEEHRMNWEPAPALGEDNRYVFCQLLGLTHNELVAYEKNGVIG